MNREIKWLLVDSDSNTLASVWPIRGKPGLWSGWIFPKQKPFREDSLEKILEIITEELNHEQPGDKASNHNTADR